MQIICTTYICGFNGFICTILELLELNFFSNFSSILIPIFLAKNIFSRSDCCRSLPVFYQHVRAPFWQLIMLSKMAWCFNNLPPTCESSLPLTSRSPWPFLTLTHLHILEPAYSLLTFFYLCSLEPGLSSVSSPFEFCFA